MRPLVRRTPPGDNEALRQAIYGGAVFQLPSTAASERLVQDAHDLLCAELGAGVDPRDAQHHLDDADFFARMGRIRKTLFLEPRFHAAVREVVGDAGFDSGRVAFDPLRLRVVRHRGHEDARAKPVYYAHRDTWYAHPQSIITWWIPLHDLAAEETFLFYPQRFRQPVENDSEIFDYGAWVRDGWSLKIGWQDRDAGREQRYPGVVGDVDPGHAVSFSCQRGQNLLFSGSHFHQTRSQSTGRTRFSLDFRVVHLGDHERGRGAPNVDNRSRGSALVDYQQPP